MKGGNILKNKRMRYVRLDFNLHEKNWTFRKMKAKINKDKKLKFESTSLCKTAVLLHETAETTDVAPSSSNSVCNYVLNPPTSCQCLFKA